MCSDARESSPESLVYQNERLIWISCWDDLDYENAITPGLCYIDGIFMKKVDVLANEFLYKLSKKKTLFFKKYTPLCNSNDIKRDFSFLWRVCWSYELMLIAMNCLEFK